jgi:hypothetical protein
MPKRAICVGINEFKNYPSAALKGCVNDVKDMVSILQEFQEFKEDEIITLTDSDATKKNIMDQLQGAVNDSKSGHLDHIVFSLSSHGSQVPDKDGDEKVDWADEAFCPHDLAVKGDEWDRDYIIIDDELNDLFTQLPKNVSLEIYLDTCHSGDGVRSIDFINMRKPRWMPPPSYKAFKKISSATVKENMSEKLLEKNITNHILWTGCQSNQTSADAFINGSWHGAFTYYLCKTIRDHQNNLSRMDLISEVRKTLKAEHYTQNPQLEYDATVRDRVLSSV